MEQPIFTAIRAGWSARSPQGWAVHGSTKEEAERLYFEAVERRAEIMSRTDPKSIDDAKALSYNREYEPAPDSEARSNPFGARRR
jgi:hypothetical protein